MRFLVAAWPHAFRRSVSAPFQVHNTLVTPGEQLSKIPHRHHPQDYFMSLSPVPSSSHRPIQGWEPAG